MFGADWSIYVLMAERFRISLKSHFGLVATQNKFNYTQAPFTYAVCVNSDLVIFLMMKISKKFYMICHKSCINAPLRSDPTPNRTHILHQNYKLIIGVKKKISVYYFIYLHSVSVPFRFTDIFFQFVHFHEKRTINFKREKHIFSRYQEFLYVFISKPTLLWND